MTTLTPNDTQHFLTAEEIDSRWREIAETLERPIWEWLGWKQCDPVAVGSNDLFHKKAKASS